MKTQILKNGTIWRRRKTLHSDFVYTTYEIITLANAKVIKKNKKQEPFDHYKLFGTIYISFKDEKGEGAKYAVKRGKIVLQQVIDQIVASQQTHVSTTEIAKICVRLIKEVDFYAGMRYASRYQR